MDSGSRGHNRPRIVFSIVVNLALSSFHYETTVALDHVVGLVHELLHLGPLDLFYFFLI